MNLEDYLWDHIRVAALKQTQGVRLSVWLWTQREVRSQVQEQIWRQVHAQVEERTLWESNQ